MRYFKIRFPPFEYYRVFPDGYYEFFVDGSKQRGKDALHIGWHTGITQPWNHNISRLEVMDVIEVSPLEVVLRFGPVVNEKGMRV